MCDLKKKKVVKHHFIIVSQRLGPPPLPLSVSIVHELFPPADVHSSGHKTGGPITTSLSL